MKDSIELPGLLEVFAVSPHRALLAWDNLWLLGKLISPGKYHTLTPHNQKIRVLYPIPHYFWFRYYHRQSEFRSPWIRQSRHSFGQFGREDLALLQSLILLKWLPSANCCSCRASHISLLYSRSSGTVTFRNQSECHISLTASKGLTLASLKPRRF